MKSDEATRTPGKSTRTKTHSRNLYPLTKRYSQQTALLKRVIGETRPEETYSSRYELSLACTSRECTQLKAFGTKQ